MGNDTPTAIEQKAAEVALEREASRRAAADPLPGALAEAFLSTAIEVGEGIFVRRIVASDWKILKWLDSPIYKLALECQKDEKLREDVNYTDEEQWEMCYQFTHTPKELRALQSKGRQAFRDAAESFADSINFIALGRIVDGINQQIVNSFKASLKYGAEEESSEKKTIVPLTT